MEILSGRSGVEDAALYYEDAGRGFPIVFIHGAGADSTLWDDQFTIFAREFRAVRYDLRGYGRSFSEPGPFSHMDDLQMLLRERGIEHAFFVGSGTGAQLAIDFALAYPHQAAGLVLVSPSIRLTATAPLGLIPNSGAPNDDEPDSDDIQGERVTTTPSEPANARGLSQLRVPSIVITGEETSPDVRSAARLLHVTIPNAIKASLNGAGQMPNHERPIQFNRILLTFFDWIKSRVERPAAGGW